MLALRARALAKFGEVDTVPVSENNPFKIEEKYKNIRKKSIQKTVRKKLSAKTVRKKLSAKNCPQKTVRKKLSAKNCPQETVRKKLSAKTVRVRVSVSVFSNIP